MGKRGNGLSASSWAPLADLTPQLADAMLNALRDAGIAAYASPTPGRTGGFLDARPAAEPTDRLFVDARESDLAKSVLQAQLPRLVDEYEHTDGGRGGDGPATVDRDDDKIFAEIVAAFDAPPAEGSRWPEQEDLDEKPAATREAAPDADTESDVEPVADSSSAASRPTAGRVVKPAEGRPGGAREDTGADDGDPAGDGTAADDHEGHFVPPTPPPLPPADPVTKGSWVALFGGPLYLLVAAMLNWEVPSWTTFAAVAAFVGGFVTLVVRMGDEPRGSGPDDGAVV